MAGGRQRIDCNWRLLPLELVDGSNPRTRQELLNGLHLRIVGRDDQDVLEGQWPHHFFAVCPCSTGRENFAYKRRNRPGLFGRAVLITDVSDRQIN